MKITQRKLLIGIGILVLLANGDRLRAGLEDSAEISAQKTTASQLARQDQAQARALERQAKAESLLAKQRYESGCTRVIRTDTMTEAHFSPGIGAVDMANQDIKLRDGLVVCNGLGDTAIVVDGVMTDIKKLTTADMQAIRSLVNP